MRLPAFLASRFVAGETPDTAIAAGVALSARGIRATFDLLGEDVEKAEDARRFAADIDGLLRAIPETIERNVSIKLTMLGLDVSEALCEELVAGLLDSARAVGGFVRIDMEGSAHTERTLRVFRRLRSRYDNVGIVLQAYLRRSADDVEESIRNRDRVRLCKGAYAEPPQIAFQPMAQIRENFTRLARRLLDDGHYPAIATHDEALVRAALAHVADAQIAPARFEFQMLYGLRPKRWDALVADGYNVRIYVPYGSHWFPYFYRRLRERKENVFFVLRSLIGG